jgi:hypothetical protein
MLIKIHMQLKIWHQCCESFISLWFVDWEIGKILIAPKSIFRKEVISRTPKHSKRIAQKNFMHKMFSLNCAEALVKVLRFEGSLQARHSKGTGNVVYAKGGSNA